VVCVGQRENVGKMTRCKNCLNEIYLDKRKGWKYTYEHVSHYMDCEKPEPKEDK